jgi:CBS domain-containing protein
MEIKEVGLRAALTCVVNDSIIEIAKKLRDGKERYVVVLDKNLIAGLISTTDISNKVVAENKVLSKIVAKDVMTKDPLCFEKNKDVLGAYLEMIKRNAFSCPITNKGKLEGMVELKSIVNYLASSKKNGKS